MSGSPHPPDGAVERELSDSSSDLLVREEPLRIAAGADAVLTMRTPGRDEDLAVGFLLTEGVIRAPAEILSLRWSPGDVAALRPDTVEIELAGPAAQRVGGRLTRTHEIRSSCGICGLVDADEILESTPPLLPGTPRLPRAAVLAFRDALAARQPLFAATGACHAAMLFTADGSVLGAGEDVGRHNALDKAIGQAVRAGHELGKAVAFLSGRAGFDLVLKCLRVRIPVMLSVSAPSALAFDLCRAAGATLVGFVRDDRMKVYWDGGRLGP